jgi:pimeloyl-ACP methyl ester carboxylesterase
LPDKYQKSGSTQFMAEFVLVHGAWHGGWCWQRVLPELIRAGHRAFAVTLTGLGDRAHQLSKEIDLNTHVADVLELISAEELVNPILVGHSYGGMVITGVADRLQESNAKVSRMVYLDAILPLPGESWSSTQLPETVKDRVLGAQTHPLLAIPIPPASGFGLEGGDARWVDRRQRPQPLATYLQGLQFSVERLTPLARHFVDCVAPAAPGIAPSRLRARDPNFWGGGWKITELQTGHDAMVSAPQMLIKLLLDEVC